MKNWRKYIPVFTLFVIAVLIHLFSLDKARVEKYYSNGAYPYISRVLRYLTGWLPFSLGDILYGLAVAFLLWKTFTALRAIWRRTITGPALLTYLRRVLVKLLAIYVLFNLFWGINYNREGIAQQLGLNMDSYTVKDVKRLNSLLLVEVNRSKMAILDRPANRIPSSDIFRGAAAAYGQAHLKYKCLNYQATSLKPSMWGWLGNYVGFLGYYNPFTGEAQVNTTVPQFLQRFTSCHEIAHQIGYGKENEANFVGYLAATASKDTAFHYSVYLDLFLYAARNLYRVDSAAAKGFAAQLLPSVKADLAEWRTFNEKHKNPAEPVVRWMYGKYLESNEQPLGVLTYDEVTAFLIAYHKKFGKI